MSDIKKVLDEIPSIKTDASVDVDKGYTDVHIELAKEQLREARLKNEALEEENRGDSQDRDQRKDFAERIYSFAAIYMFGVFVILFLSGTQTTNF